MSELTPELKILRTLCLDAGRILLDERFELRRIGFKSATDMVTDIDQRLETLIVDRLRAAFPEDGILAEEGTCEAGSSGRVWHLDPLDGTTNYIHGHPVFAISMGCADPAGLLLGAVYAPAMDELFLASRGGGARLECPAGGLSRPITASGETEVGRALLGTGFPYRRDGLVNLNSDIVNAFLLANCHGVRRCGSAALDLCSVAAGRLDGYWEFHLNRWDVAAGALIASEAGALVTDLDGDRGVPDGHSIVAAAPDLHRTMIAMIRDCLPDTGLPVKERS